MRKAGTMMGTMLLAVGLWAFNAMADDDHGHDNNGNGGNVTASATVTGGGFEALLVGSSVGQHVAGVPSGGAPWKITVGAVEISGNGRVEVVIRGLLISAGTAINTVGPVTMIDASLVCGDVVAATTKAVPLSTNGNAQIEDTITVPSPCIAPAVLIRVAATTTGPVVNGPFIAVNALSSGNAGKGNNDDN